MIDVSIIIPTYNTPENQLQRCFESIFSQSVRNYEVLVIDDGSENAFADNLQALNKKYPFRLLKQKNSGVSSARNLGISESTGKYIMFVDADDTLEKESLYRGLNLAEKYDSDIILGGINIVDGDNTRKCTIKQNEEMVLSAKEEIRELEKFMISIRCEKNSEKFGNLRCTGPWAKLIKKEILQDLCFDRNLQIYEDLLFNLNILENSERVVIDNKICYNYYIYSDSAIHKYKENGVEQLNYFIEKLRCKVDDCNELGSAASVKTIECLGRVFTNTVFHKNNKNGGRLRQTKEILSENSVGYLLNLYDKNSYSFKNFKEKCLWVMFRRKMSAAVYIYYSLKRLK